MTERQDRFGDFHPLVTLVWFGCTAVFAVLLRHPVCLAGALLFSTAYAVETGGLRVPGLAGIVFLLTAVLNPAFSHAGATILCYLPDGNPLTMESIACGIASGAVLASTILLFSCLTRVFTADKTAYLLGRFAPSLSMLFSVALGFVPKLRRRALQIRSARRALAVTKRDGLRQKTAEALRVFSALTSWSLEGTADTADSMRCRGYGLHGRTAFRLWRFEMRDGVLLAVIVMTAAWVTLTAAVGMIGFEYYPVLHGADLNPGSVSAFAAYWLLCAVPVLINLWEEVRWHCLTSKI